MTDPLRFDPTAYEDKSLTLGGRTIAYRAWEGIAYCANPLDPIQVMNVYAPLGYFADEKDAGEKNTAQRHAAYDAQSAPIFMPNTSGGYMPGPADAPGEGRFFATNAVFDALEHGYVVACAGVRGRTSGATSDEFFEGAKATATDGVATGRMVGKAPAFVVDMKAAIRYLRHNADVVPGGVERIFTSGTSAGGALSALTGASGNSEDFAPYLQEIGAAMDERDDICGANCYCPIHNLENADAAYEWLFHDIADYHITHFRRRDGHVVKIEEPGVMDEKGLALSRELAAAFPAYVNSLGLTDEDGTPLTLDEAGRGTFLDHVIRHLVAAAQRELDTRNSQTRLAHLMTAGSAVDEQDWIAIQDGTVTGIDWEGFRHAITRMKPAPAFDALDLHSPENDEFGTQDVPRKHFTAFSTAHSTVAGELADPHVVAMMNPLTYVGEQGCCAHWRVRHGSYDRDTSVAIPVILATALANAGHDVDFSLPWGLPHSGDYDLPELFAWIDGICLSDARPSDTRPSDPQPARLA